MQHQELIPHLFRTEFSKIAAVLCKLLSIEHLAIAEDLTSDTFLAAYETWSYKGVPENPTAWLYTVAKNKARNYINKNKLFNTKIAADLQKSAPLTEEIEIDLSEKNIADSQLQMLFTVCHPSISPTSQICLALRILCGFGVDEIATAFLSNTETISKRLYRAKETLRHEKVAIVFPGVSEMQERLETVLTTLYLFFNEGYYSESSHTPLRTDLCLEAMRLTYLLANNELTALPQVHALLALMCFHASRFEARTNGNGETILYAEQDQSLWNRELITKGVELLHKASTGSQVSKYHMEASIAYWHTTNDNRKWENILALHNQLRQISPSPIAALNRVFAVSMVSGKIAAIAEAEKLAYTDHHLYFMLLGELHKQIDNKKANQYFLKALSLAKTNSDRHTIQKNIDLL